MFEPNYAYKIMLTIFANFFLAFRVEKFWLSHEFFHTDWTDFQFYHSQATVLFTSSVIVRLKSIQKEKNSCPFDLRESFLASFLEHLAGALRIKLNNFWNIMYQIYRQHKSWRNVLTLSIWLLQRLFHSNMLDYK